MTKFIVENKSADCRLFVCSRCDVTVVGELTTECAIDVFDGRDSLELYEHIIESTGVGFDPYQVNIEGVRVETSNFCWDCVQEINDCKLIDDLIGME